MGPVRQNPIQRTAELRLPRPRRAPAAFRCGPLFRCGNFLLLLLPRTVFMSPVAIRPILDRWRVRW